MKIARITSLALVASLALPTISQAQAPQEFHFGGVVNTSVNLAGFGIGPYQASKAPFTTNFNIFCLDFDNVAQSVWTGRVLTFAEAVSPTYTDATHRALGTTPSWGILELRAAAYLTTQFTPANLTLNGGQWDDIHGAIWSLFSTNTTVQVDNYATYRATALAYAAAHPNDFDNYSMIVDNNAFNDKYVGPLNQTFITDDGSISTRVVTPEPGTYALMAAGLLAMGYVRRRRNA